MVFVKSIGMLLVVVCQPIVLLTVYIKKLNTVNTDPLYYL